MSWTDDHEWLGILWFQEIGDEPSGTSVPVPKLDRVAELEVELAFGLQDQVFPESRAGWAQPRPACPGHPHPADPAVVDGAAWWTCPRSGERLCRIGQLGAATAGA